MPVDEELKKLIRSSYDSNARLREKSEIEGWKRDELHWFLSSFPSVNGLKLLDVGAGAGQHSEYLTSKGFDVHCIDNSAEMVQFCRARNLTATVMDFYSMEFPDAAFDAVWSMNALLHVPKKSLPIVLEGIHRIMKPGGLCYLGLYGGHDHEGIWENDPYMPQRFFSFFTHEGIREAAGADFEIVDFHIVEMPQSSVDFHSMVLRRVGR